MRRTAPCASSTSLPQLSHTRMVLRAISPPEFDFARSLRGGAGGANSPRAEQAQGGELFAIEPGIARADHAQMAGPEILDRSPVEILLDHRRADVRGTSDGRRVAKLLADLAHHRCDLALPVARRGGLAHLGELDRCD